MNRFVKLTLALGAVVLMYTPTQSQAHEPGCGPHYVTRGCYTPYTCMPPVRRVVVRPAVVVNECNVCRPVEVCRPIHAAGCHEVRVHHHGHCR